MRAATCTPVDFVADDHFFGRDSGLLCRGLQQAGVDCISIMPGERSPDEPADMLRCSPLDLHDPIWWRSLELNFVVLYAWGDPAHRGIARAIMEAGIFLIQNLDTAGIETPYGNRSRWWISLRDQFRGPQPIKKKVRLIVKGLRDLCPALYENSRLGMIDQSDIVATVSPPAAASMEKYSAALGFGNIARKLVIVPHPVPESMVYRGEVKENLVLCVGRWQTGDSHQKDPRILLETIRLFLDSQPQWKADIIGRGAPGLSSQTSDWPHGLRDRIKFTGALDREELRKHYLKSRILLCPSRYESFHISSAEAVCCGCSIVVADHPLLSSTAWFTSRNSGTLSPERTSGALANSLRLEAKEWDADRRDPVAISAYWIEQVHAPKVAQNIVNVIRRPNLERNSAP